MTRRLIAASLAAALAACTHVPLGSILPLIRIKFGTTEISRVRAAVKLPDSLRPRPGGVRMTVTMGLAGEPPQSQKFDLVETRDPEDQPALAAFASQGSVIYAYRLAPDDVARMERMRADMISRGEALKQEGKSPGGNLTIRIGAEESLPHPRSGQRAAAHHHLPQNQRDRRIRDCAARCRSAPGTDDQGQDRHDAAVLRRGRNPATGGVLNPPWIPGPSGHRIGPPQRGQLVN
jgi:hypothetical protein